MGINKVKTFKVGQYTIYSAGAMLAIANSASAAPYVIDATDLTTLGTTSTDIADSLVTNMVKILSVMVPLIVVGFIIRVVLKRI